MSEEQDGIRAVQRLRFTFGKEGPARYISHLDLARTLERALNRSRIPLAYSQGFNRRPRLSLAAALPLGYTSEAELADIWLTEPVDPAVVQERLMDRMAPGIAVMEMLDVPLDGPSLQQSLLAAAYRATFLDAVDVTDLQQGVVGLLAADSLPRERQRAKDKRPKPYDLRPLIIELGVDTESEPAPLLLMHLVQTPTQTGRPDEVLASLGFDPLDVRVHRTRLFLDESEPQ
jgi:radical SAM-linked protein